MSGITNAPSRLLTDTPEMRKYARKEREKFPASPMVVNGSVGRPTL